MAPESVQYLLKDSGDTRDYAAAEEAKTSGGGGGERVDEVWGGGGGGGGGGGHGLEVSPGSVLDEAVTDGDVTDDGGGGGGGGGGGVDGGVGGRKHVSEGSVGGGRGRVEVERDQLQVEGASMTMGSVQAGGTVGEGEFSGRRHHGVVTAEGGGGGGGVGHGCGTESVCVWGFVGVKHAVGEVEWNKNKKEENIKWDPSSTQK